MSYPKIIKIVVFAILSIAFAQAGVLTNLGGTKGQADADLKVLENHFKDADFSIAAKNEHLELHYYNEFKDKNLDLLNFYRIYNKDEMRKFLLINPDYGAYTPFNFLAFKKLSNAEGGDTTWYGHLDADTMLDIIGEKKQENRDRFKNMISKLDKVVTDEMKPTVTKKLSFDQSLPKHTLLKMVKKFDNEDVEEFVEEFIMKHDSLFTQHHFVIAGFLDLKFEFEDLDMDFDKYDAYWVSSLCHFKFSNAIFNHGSPRAGVFAPCSIYFYIPKGKKELHVGYAKVDNWISTTNIKDQAQIDFMKKVADEVQSVFEELGFKVEADVDNQPTKAKVTNKNDDVSTQLNEIKSMMMSMQGEIKQLKEIILNKNTNATKSVPEVKSKFKGKKFDLEAGQAEKLSAYYVANPQSIDKLKEALIANGFEILSQQEILKNETVLSVTNDQLKSANSFLSVINIVITKDSEIRVQNPSYLAAAYLKNGYKYGDFKKTLSSLQKVLGDMYNTDEMLEYDKLKEYSFMPNTAKVEDLIEITDDQDIIKKVENENDEKHIAYKLKLPNGSMLIGHKLQKRTNRFLKKLAQEKNALLLPYQSMIKDGDVTIMDPTYYLALSLPTLTMEEFMKIASTPDAIARDIRRAYR